MISDASHPLHKLLNANGKLTRSTTAGMNQLVWFENPSIVEASHYASAKGLAGAPDRLVVMSAYENRPLSATLEHPKIGGQMLESGKVLSIGSAPVDFRPPLRSSTSVKFASAPRPRRFTVRPPNITHTATASATCGGICHLDSLGSFTPPAMPPACGTRCYRLPRDFAPAYSG